MDTIEHEQSVVTALQPIVVRKVPLIAALSCVSKEETRYNLQGVYLHSIDNEVRLVSTDGHRMFVHSRDVEEGEVVPDWLREGVIVPAENLKARLAFFPDLVKFSYHQDAARLEMTDPWIGETLFRFAPVQGTYPDYRRILDDIKVLEGREVPDMSSVGYTAAYLKGVGDIAKLLGDTTVRMFGGQSATDPTLITFPASPGSVLILMPSRVDQDLPRSTVKVISGAVGLTVSALKAHQTRWAQRIETGKTKADIAAAERRVKEYEQRIAAILMRTQAPAALPAPSEPSQETDDTSPSVEATAQESGSPLQDTGVAAPGDLRPLKWTLSEAEQETAKYRKSLSARKRKGALRSFAQTVERELRRGGVKLLPVPDSAIETCFSDGMGYFNAGLRLRDAYREQPTILDDEPVKITDPIADAMSRAQAVSETLPADQARMVKGGEVVISGEAASDLVAAARAQWSGKRREKELLRFRADINAIFSHDERGVTLETLSEPVPLEEWFESGLTVPIAAARALEWQVNRAKPGPKRKRTKAAPEPIQPIEPEPEHPQPSKTEARKPKVLAAAAAKAAPSPTKRAKVAA